MKKYILTAIALILCHYRSALPQDLSKQVIKLIATKQEYDHYSPWMKKGLQKITMNGCVVGKNLIITSAYSLADVTMIEAVKLGESKKYNVDIIVKDYLCGLALLTVTDKNFFNGLEDSEILPPQKLIGQTCSIYRWDSEGNFREYAAVAINTSLRIYKPNCGVLTHTMATEMEAGGYGEPVYKDDKLAGISTGFDGATKSIVAIGVDTIKRMLDDISDGSYEGMPFFWIQATPLEGDVNLRELLGLEERETGVCIDKIHPLSSGKETLQNGDVILNINGVAIEDSGLYRSPSYGRLNYNGLIYLNHFINDDIHITVVRKSERIPLQFKLKGANLDRMTLSLTPFDSQPEYMVVGGCVFQHLSLGYMKTWGDSWEKQCDRRLLYHYRTKVWDKSDDGRKVVILNRVLPAAVNSGYQDLSSLVLERVNGAVVKNIMELKAAVSSSTGNWLKFDFTGKTSIVLEKKSVLESEDDILRTYRIPSPWYLTPVPGSEQ